MNNHRRTLLGKFLSLCALTVGLGRTSGKLALPQICDRNCPVKGCGSSCFEEKLHRDSHLCRLNNHRF